MPNIEIKARYADLSKGREIANRNNAKYVGVLHQIDTYFNTAKGRLKLREIPGEGAWLIPYSKSYERRPTRSDYQLLEAQNPDAVKSLFASLVGTRFVVEKTREVFLIDNVRLHLDQVKGLGTFIEFEAVFDNDTAEVRERESRKVAELMQTFGITEADLLTSGYVDMLEIQKTKEAHTQSTNEAKSPGYFYISNPYNGTNEQREHRAQIAAQTCGKLLRMGVHGWSPIVHNHAMMRAFDQFTLEERRTLILDFDFSLLCASKGMIVLELEGWDQSYGVSAEIKFCEEMGLPIKYLRPADLDSGKDLHEILRDTPPPPQVRLK